MKTFGLALLKNRKYVKEIYLATESVLSYIFTPAVFPKC